MRSTEKGRDSETNVPPTPPSSQHGPSSLPPDASMHGLARVRHLRPPPGTLGARSAAKIKIPSPERSPRPFRYDMKRLWPCLAAVIVHASCTGVEDFGVYWDKGIVDPALAGSWKKVGLPGRDSNGVPGPDMLRFTRSGSSYAFQAINPIDQTEAPEDIERQKADNEARLSARTLPIGRHKLLMVRDAAGQGKDAIERYEVQRGTFREYIMNNGAGVEFLATKHPTAKNIRKNTGEGEYVEIDKFDDEVFQILSEIADNPAYWILSCEYKRVP